MKVALKSMSKARGILVAKLLEHVHQVLGHVSKLVHRAGHILNQHTGACRDMTKAGGTLCRIKGGHIKRSVKNAARESLISRFPAVVIEQGINASQLLCAFYEHVPLHIFFARQYGTPDLAPIPNRDCQQSVV